MALTAPQPGLFDSDAAGSSVFFLTNRNNLLRVMAAGLLMPAAGFAAKYYDDLLRLAAGRLPLLALGASADLAAMVAPEPQAFPVILELRCGKLADSAFPALMEDGSHGTAGWANPAARAWAPSGLLPFADTVAAIHFRTDRERTEFEARDYEDTRPRADMHRVTPVLFEAAGPSADQVTGWLTSLAPPDHPSADEIVMEDRRSGALLLGVSTAVPDDAELRGWGHLLTGKKPGRQAGEVVSRVGRAIDGAAKVREPEDVALQICIETLAATNRLEAWRPEAILVQIRDRLGIQLKGKADPMAPALDRAAGILRAEETFEGLKTGGSPTLKALLITLLRPEPERSVGWDPGGPGSNPEVLNLAATMVGALTGRSMTKVALRPPDLDDSLARLEADRLSTSKDRAMAPYRAASVAVEHSENTLVLKIGSATLTVRPIPGQVEEPIKVDGVLLEDPIVRERAVQIAVKNGWTDSVESVVEATTAQLTTQFPLGSRGPITIRFAGIGSIRHELVIDVFLKHIDQGDIPPEEAAALRMRDAPPALPD